MRAAAHAQRGQVLVLGLVLATLLGLAWLRYFATAQVTASKARMVHGLDAASYSGALVQARTLNFLAYLNRARLGHQLAMAHLLTLGSWAHFGGMQAQRLAQGNPPAYLIGMLFGAGHGRAYLAAAAAAGLNHQTQVGGSLASAFAAHESLFMINRPPYPTRWLRASQRRVWPSCVRFWRHITQSLAGRY
jgi:hypothetical protein